MLCVWGCVWGVGVGVFGYVCVCVCVGLCGGVLVCVLNILCNLFSVMHVNTCNLNARWYGVPIPITCNYNYVC